MERQKKKKQAVLKNNCTAADLLYTKNYHSSQNLYEETLPRHCISPNDEKRRRNPPINAFWVLALYLLT